MWQSKHSFRNTLWVVHLPQCIHPHKLQHRLHYREYHHLIHSFQNRFVDLCKHFHGSMMGQYHSSVHWCCRITIQCRVCRTTCIFTNVLLCRGTRSRIVADIVSSIVALIRGRRSTLIRCTLICCGCCCLIRWTSNCRRLSSLIRRTTKGTTIVSLIGLTKLVDNLLSR